MKNELPVGRPHFESLAYHLRVSYLLRWWETISAADIRQAYPGDEAQYLEADAFRLNLGHMDADVAQALQDLIDDGLVKVEVMSYEVASKHYRDTVKQWERWGSIPRGGAEASVQAKQQLDPVFQGNGCWYTDASGMRVDLTAHGAHVFPKLTEKGNQLWDLFPQQEERLRREAIGVESHSS